LTHSSVILVGTLATRGRMCGVCDHTHRGAARCTWVVIWALAGVFACKTVVKQQPNRDQKKRSRRQAAVEFSECTIHALQDAMQYSRTGGTLAWPGHSRAQ
jgi:hypothetical protein